MALTTFPLLELPVELILTVVDQMDPASQCALAQTSRSLRDPLSAGPAALTGDAWHAFMHGRANGQPGHSFCLVCRSIHPVEHPFYGTWTSQCFGTVPHSYTELNHGDFEIRQGWENAQTAMQIPCINIERGYNLHFDLVRHVMACHRLGHDIRPDLARFAYTDKHEGRQTTVEARVSARGHFLIQRSVRVPAELRRTKKGTHVVQTIGAPVVPCGHHRIPRGGGRAVRRLTGGPAQLRQCADCMTDWRFTRLPGPAGPAVRFDIWHDFGPAEGAAAYDDWFEGFNCSWGVAEPPLPERVEVFPEAWDAALVGDAPDPRWRLLEEPDRQKAAPRPSDGGRCMVM